MKSVSYTFHVSIKPSAGKVSHTKLGRVWHKTCNSVERDIWHAYTSKWAFNVVVNNASGTIGCPFEIQHQSFERLRIILILEQCKEWNIKLCWQSLLCY